MDIGILQPTVSNSLLWVYNSYTTHVGGYPQRAVTHLVYIIYIFLTAALTANQREFPRRWMEQCHATIGANPDAVTAVTIYAPHVVSRQAGSIPFLMSEMLRLACTYIDDAHAIFNVSQIQVTANVASSAVGVIQLVILFNVCGLVCGTVEMLYLSVCKNQPHAALRFHDVFDTGVFQTILMGQEPHRRMAFIIYYQTIFCTYEHQACWLMPFQCSGFQSETIACILSGQPADIVCQLHEIASRWPFGDEKCMTTGTRYSVHT